jgi:hypothetical protein
MAHWRRIASGRRRLMVALPANGTGPVDGAKPGGDERIGLRTGLSRVADRGGPGRSQDHAIEIARVIRVGKQVEGLI